MDFANFFLFRVALTSIFLAIFMTLSNHLSVPPSGKAWLLLFVTATVDVIISRMLYYWALRQMRLGIHTIVLTLTPVLTVLWSLAFFNERPTWQGLLGGLIVLLGISFVALAQRQQTQALQKPST